LSTHGGRERRPHDDEEIEIAFRTVVTTHRERTMQIYADEIAIKGLLQFFNKLGWPLTDVEIGRRPRLCPGGRVRSQVDQSAPSLALILTAAARCGQNEVARK